MREAILEVIGAVVVTTVILGVPILSFVSFTHDWNGFIVTILFVGLIVDFLYVSSMLIGGKE